MSSKLSTVQLRLVVCGGVQEAQPLAANLPARALKKAQPLAASLTSCESDDKTPNFAS